MLSSTQRETRDADAAVPTAPQQQLLTLLAGKMISATLCTLARAGIADHLADGPLPVAELAERSGTHAATLHRFLRAAASVRVFRELDDKTFELTETGTLMRSDVPGTLRYLAYLYGEQSVWNCFANALDTLRTGEPAGPALRGGASWFEYMDRSDEYAEVFHKAMTGVSNQAAQVAATYDFSRFQWVADIGGGQGALLSAVLAANPGQRGLLFDTNSALTGAGSLLSERGVADRVDMVGGDFFQAVPTGPDAYLLKAILHDWNDADSIRILHNIRTAIGDSDHAQVFIIDAVVPEGNEWHFSKAMDIAMAVSLGGKERDLPQWRELLLKAGFDLISATRTAPPHWIIEARPTQRTRR